MKYLLILFIATIKISSAQIKFDANFESGNLSSVETNDSIHFFVRTISDIGGRWFYFRITGIDGKYIEVIIENSDVNRPMYSYDNRVFQRFTQSESPSYNLFKKTFDYDTVYVAYYTPYTYSYLQQRIRDWERSSFVKVDTLGFTDHNLAMQEVIITDPDIPDANKHRVWIHARTHPGETPSSWHFDGIVQKLLEEDDVIDFYRKNIIFHLFPFNNPEGVYFGRSRTNYYGVDQEREWNKPDAETAKEVLMLKNRMIEINSEKVISVFLNLHSQAASYCTFWIHTPGSTSEYFYRREYQFSNLNTSDNPYFYPWDYSESNLQDYFPEGWLWNNHGDQVMALTYETPYDKYSEGTWVTNENLFELGYRTVYAVAEYLELSHPKHLILDNRNAVVDGTYTESQQGLEFYGDDFYEIDQNTAVVFLSGALEPGRYDVYGWWSSSNDYSFQSKFEISSGFNDPIILEKTQRTNGSQWNFLTQLELTTSLPVQIKLSGNSTGQAAADAFRIIFREPISSLTENIIPNNFKLYQNYPNPFNPSTTIRFSLKQNSNVMLRVFDSLGRLIDVTVNRPLSAGTHEVIFNTLNYPNLSSGTYYYQLIVGSHSETKGMVFIK